MRQGEQLPAPVTADVTVHADSQGQDSLGKSREKEVLARGVIG